MIKNLLCLEVKTLTRIH